MPRILIVEAMQEISSFNPTTSGFEAFVIQRGQELIDAQRGSNTSIAGAVEVFEATPGVEIVLAYAARPFSAGLLTREGFERLSTELLDHVRERAAGVDAVYFSLHGAMAADGELDPEGYLLEQVRAIVGNEVPIVASLDMHGILTARMLQHLDGLTIFHTYPHVDFDDTGRRAAELLLKVLAGTRPVIARVVMPTLVRGDELITATGLFGRLIGQAQELERSGTALAAGFMIGNPFTDVPELSSQAVVVTDGDAESAEREAVRLAEAFWPHRAQMQADLMPVEDAVALAMSLDGPVILTDAADATSSGATGDSNVILRALLDAGYPGKVLVPVVDPPAVEAAFAAGVGATITVPIGGARDPRFTPLELEVTVDLLSRGHAVHETMGAANECGNTAVLLHGNVTIVAITKPANFFDRSVFRAAGREPERYDAIVVKSPHCEPHMYVEWAERNINVDAPGSTSANLPTLGHTICARPMFPMEPDATFTPVTEVFAR